VGLFNGFVVRLSIKFTFILLNGLYVAYMRKETPINYLTGCFLRYSINADSIILVDGIIVCSEYSFSSTTNLFGNVVEYRVLVFNPFVVVVMRTLPFLKLIKFTIINA